jgi:hypothetical protein
MTKKAKLLMDEFSPSEYPRNFWMLPRGIAQLEGLSNDAKLLYAALFTLSMKYDTAFATKETLQEYLGNPSKSSLYRWQAELVNAGLLRVLQKGRGLSNNYYFLRHPALGNAEEGEFELGARYLYRSKQYNTQTIVSEEEARAIFKDEIREWYNDGLSGNVQPFPKPSWPFNRVQYSKYRKEWEDRLNAELVNGM